MQARSYYNEIDPFAAQWLRNLIAAGHIAPGDVDERSIVDVKADDLKSYTQCHFFAGIGGWSLAARLAGWPDDKPLWTGSCPCQPFSAAGLHKGEADERHLWPVLANLVRQCRPTVVAGEQVASKAGLRWLDGVCADLEAAQYSVWAADICAAGVGAPHIRQRLWWLGHSSVEGFQGRGNHASQQDGQQGTLSGTDGPALRMADAIGQRGCLGTTGVQHATDAGKPGKDGWGSHYVGCADGKSRRVEPSILPLAHGVPGRVGRLRAYGNAIVPQVAAQILQAYLEG